MENSVRDVLDRMKAGAVKLERSPLKPASDFRKLVHDVLAWGGTFAPSAVDMLLLLEGASVVKGRRF